MDVVFDLEIAILAWVGPVNRIVPNVFASLNLLCVIVQISLGVKIKVHGVVSKVS